MQTPIPTIPQIAEMLRHHVNYDNDAPRLIAEEVLPILKIELTYKEVLDIKDIRSDINSNADDLSEIADAIVDEDDPLTKEESFRQISKIVKNLRDL